VAYFSHNRRLVNGWYLCLRKALSPKGERVGVGGVEDKWRLVDKEGRLTVTYHPVAPPVFCGVECLVSAMDNAHLTLFRLMGCGYTDADRGLNTMTVGDNVAGEFFPESFQGMERLCLFRIGEYDEKLLTAIAENNIVFPHPLLNGGGDMSQDVVA
jgi:hypothetical protein